MTHQDILSIRDAEVFARIGRTEVSTGCRSFYSKSNRLVMDRLSGQRTTEKFFHNFTVNGAGATIIDVSTVLHFFSAEYSRIGSHFIRIAGNEKRVLINEYPEYLVLVSRMLSTSDSLRESVSAAGPQRELHPEAMSKFVDAANVGKRAMWGEIGAWANDEIIRINQELRNTEADTPEYIRIKVQRSTVNTLITNSAEHIVRFK